MFIWAHWKARSGLPISVNWTFFARCYTAEALQANIGWKSAISLKRGPDDPKFQVEGVAPTVPFFFSENYRLNDLSYVVKISTDLSSVLSQCTRLPDRRTEFSSLDRVCVACNAITNQHRLYCSCWITVFFVWTTSFKSYLNYTRFGHMTEWCHIDMFDASALFNFCFPRSDVSWILLSAVNKLLVCIKSRSGARFSKNLRTNLGKT